MISICAFTAERWLAVCHSLRMNVKTRKFCWTFASIICFVLAFLTGLRTENFSVEEVEIGGNKTIEICFGDVSDFYTYTTLIIFVFSYLIPVLMLATMSFQIAATARRAAHTVQTECSRASTKMISLLVAVVVSFLICWSPAQILRLNNLFPVLNLTPLEGAVAGSIAACCYYLNCAVNPILYNMFSQKFREALLHMVNSGRATAPARMTCSTSDGNHKLHLVESNRWGKKIPKKLVIGHITKTDKDDMNGKEKFRGLSMPLSKSLPPALFSESDELGSDNSREPVIDPSLIYPTRRPRFDGGIAFPPVLPMIQGQDRGLPFGTVHNQMSFRSTSRRKSKGEFRKEH
ncbi:unnamed protein product [Cylicocyclus nassatus]|uniref:G-protein coupled receptors family 1 profile domain-containing protein n=1 Tax=Cylicocyclus nassatus TaxID=53992 RepID=A0AA36H653_CYLNA|nr:unnamed protein product [Cylicocyclus nassatus]